MSIFRKLLENIMYLPKINNTPINLIKESLLIFNKYLKTSNFPFFIDVKKEISLKIIQMIRIILALIKLQTIFSYSDNYKQNNSSNLIRNITLIILIYLCSLSNNLKDEKFISLTHSSKSFHESTYLLKLDDPEKNFQENILHTMNTDDSLGGITNREKFSNNGLKKNLEGYITDDISEDEDLDVITNKHNCFLIKKAIF